MFLQYIMSFPCAKSVTLFMFISPLILTVNHVKAGNILVWMNFESKSRVFRLKPLIESLANRNHSVTLVTPFSGNTYPNYQSTLFPVPILDSDLLNNTNINVMQVDFDLSEKMPHRQFFHGTASIFDWDSKNEIIRSAKVTLDLPQVRKLIQDPPRFDVVIVSASSLDLGLFLAKRVFKSPTIINSNLRRLFYVDILQGNVFNPSYISNELLNGYSNQMTFFERVQNTLAALAIFVGVFTCSYYGGIASFLQDAFNLDRIDSTFALVSEVDMIFSNNHPVFEGVQPSLPNCIDVGGLQLREPKPLEDQIKKWVESADNGVVLIALGTVIRSKDMPKEQIDIFKSVFSKMNEYKFIWKLELDDEELLKDMPHNVFVHNWLPQQDILGHPKLKLLITHAGWSSFEEGLFHGAPMLGMPLFADQFSNSARMVRMGCGLEQHWKSLNERDLMSKIEEVIKNSTYKEKSMYYSALLKDSEVSSLEKAVFYTEYVMKHQGAGALKSKALGDLSWIEERSLDVIGFIILVTTFLVWLAKKLIL